MGNYERAEGILDKYSKGKLSATETQKELKKFGYGANLRGKSNTIPVYPLDGGDGFDVELAEGGAMLNKQMELFEDGGLMDEGGMVDEESGNEVPVGSTREEVRDDIPAQLSEGEFVLPADVVRYHGLEKIMELRDEAKAGLQKMEAMGQMGNSEEATLDDDVPFSMDDLEMEDDGTVEYQVGGYVPPQNVSFQQSQFAGYQPQAVQPVTPPTTAPAYQAPTQQFTPTMPTGPVPTFAQFTQPTSVTYYDANGNTIQIPVDANGNPLIPVPAGFSPTKPTTATPTAPTTTPTYQAPQQPTGGEGPSAEQLQQQEEYKQTVNERMQAAEELGYTKKQNVIEAILPFVVPGGSLLMPNPDRGTVLVDGTIADGKGGSFDPISGEKIGAAGGILGNIATALGVGKKEEISEAASKMGVSPASIEGLKTIKGEKSIQDLIEGRVDTSAVKPAAVTDADIDAAVKAGLGTREEILANIAKADAQDTKVETALVTEKGAAGEVAQKAAEKFAETPEELDTRVDKIVDYMNTITKGDVKVVSREPGGNVVIEGPDALGTGKVTTVVTPEGDLTRTYEGQEEPASKYQKTNLGVPSRVAAMEAGKEVRDKADRVAAAQRTAAAAQAEAGERRASFPTRGESMQSRYDEQAAKYESQGYSPSRAASAARNKVQADDEARAQTGNPKASAVTSSTGNAVRSSTGNVVTSSPPSDDGPSDSKIVCTAMNNAYGFGSFRQTIWLKHSKDLDPAYQKGYHRIFRPLIKFAYSNQKWYNIAVRKTLEGIARRRTADIWMQQKGKRHPIGAIERAILEPICYIVGKIK